MQLALGQNGCLRGSHAASSRHMNATRGVLRVHAVAGAASGSTSPPQPSMPKGKQVSQEHTPAMTFLCSSDWETYKLAHESLYKMCLCLHAFPSCMSSCSRCCATPHHHLRVLPLQPHQQRTLLPCINRQAHHPAHVISVQVLAHSPMLCLAACAAACLLRLMSYVYCCPASRRALLSCLGSCTV
jgi:hypothetical protein